MKTEKKEPIVNGSFNSLLTIEEMYEFDVATKKNLAFSIDSKLHFLFRPDIDKEILLATDSLIPKLAMRILTVQKTLMSSLKQFLPHIENGKLILNTKLIYEELFLVQKSAMHKPNLDLVVL